MGIDTVTLNVQEAVLPDVSTAVQVTCVVPSGKKEPDEGTQLTEAMAQLSKAIGVGKVTVAPFSPALLGTEMSAGQIIMGGSASSMVTLKVQAALLPLGSKARQVTVVVPTGKKLPGAGLQMVFTVPGQLFVAMAAKLKTAPHWPGSLFKVMLMGQVMVGGSLSSTITAKVQEDTLSEASVAVQVTVVVPRGKVDPGGGSQEKVTPGQLSVAMGGG